ncbi:hypothetical protein DFH07DRAFT_795555 [Mycena maculata]|uniref:F-box domain-containing protein n=1 Tax=Mycena maculata TaxID=230809 RepID=A0AAD7K5M3_9AGAR|nr:hypothetical protein DFH07DRAFT_795555 [Mycena maculata]
MAMAALPYLCLEIIQQIGGELPNCDQMNLRAVCRELGVAIDPLFYTFFTLRGDRMRRDNGLYIMERLAARQIGWSHFAKTVHIMPGSKPETGEATGPKYYPSDPALPNLLVSALASMHNIQTVVWTVHANDPDWVREAICDSLNTLPLLSDLQLKTEGGVHLGLTPVPSLTKLRIESLDWRPVEMVQDICQVVGRSHHLSSLHLSGTSDWSKVWTLLRATLLRPKDSARIHLKELTTSFVTSDLLTYLHSYSGLESISLETSQNHRPKPDPLADRFFGTVLASHALTLVELSCPAGHEGRWSFGPHNVDAILPLRKLEILHLSVNPQDVADVEPPMNAVTLLLSTAQMLPALRLLEISSAARYRGRCEENIKTAIENFTSHLESAAVVCADEDVYELAPVLSDEPGERSTILAYRILDPVPSAVQILRT